jgi:hypothetical protein
MLTQEHLTHQQRQLREVNERIRDVAELDASVFICECSDVDCFGTLELTLEEYDRIRSVPTWFILTPGHADPTVGRVVNENAAFVVVDCSTDAKA